MRGLGRFAVMSRYRAILNLRLLPGMYDVLAQRSRNECEHGVGGWVGAILRNKYICCACTHKFVFSLFSPLLREACPSFAVTIHASIFPRLEDMYEPVSFKLAEGCREEWAWPRRQAYVPEVRRTVQRRNNSAE